MDMFAWKPAPKKKLLPDEVDGILERLVMARTVDVSQVPMNQPASPESPELGLHRAILFDAIQCAVRHHDSPSSAQRSEATSAIRWIESNSESYFLSFVPICHRFRLDPEWIRRLVRSRIRKDRPLVAAEAAEAA